MSVAIRTATRIADQDDLGSVPGAGNDGYALTWDNGAGAFVLTALSAGVTDHGALTGLTDDDHTGYALLAGRSGGQTLYGGTDANDDITIHGTSNATRTTSYVLLQPTAGNVGIGTTSPTLGKLHVQGDSAGGNVGTFVKDLSTTGLGLIQVRNDSDYYGSFVVYGSAYANVALRNNASLAARSSFFFIADGGVATGGTNSINFLTGGYDATTQIRMKVTGVGLVGIGTTAPGSLLHGLLTSAATDAVTNVLTIGHDTTGTAAAGFGAGQLFALESSTTAAQNAARIQALWYEATHATRKADLVGTAYDAGGEREGWRVRGDGTGPALGFYGVSPIARAVLATGAGASVDDVITALQNLGLVKQS